MAKTFLADLRISPNWIELDRYTRIDTGVPVILPPALAAQLRQGNAFQVAGASPPEADQRADYPRYNG